MFKNFERCVATKILSILLLIDVSIGVVVSLYEGQTLWALSFTAVLLTVTISIISTTNQDDG
jgi:hypothetical protein